MEPSSVRSLRIAVADDEPLIRRFFQELLPDMGHTVVAVAENGRELVELCRQMGAKDPKLLANSLMLLLSGAFAARLVYDGREQIAAVCGAAQALLDSGMAGNARR